MVEELKIRIADYEKIESDLTRRGAKFSGELHVIDTYFKQPAGEVLKITEDDTGDFLVNLKSKNGKFEIARYERVVEARELKDKLARELGVKCVLKKKRRFWKLDGISLNINLIEGVGEFLIVEGERLSPDVITEKLKIKKPEFVTVSFDELKR